jgi:phosphoketolase
MIREFDLDMFYVAGPGHGGPALVGYTYLEGTYSEVYPDVGQDEAGLKKLFMQFSFPGGISSHVASTTPGSIHEGGELGYSLSHAFGAAFDNPGLIVACVIGDGEAETGPLATSWQSTRLGWTGPKVIDGVAVEGTFRAHQVPLLVDSGHPRHVGQLESWMHSYKPEELFDEPGRLRPELAALAPEGDRRMGANPHANGGLLLRGLRMPDFRAYAAQIRAGHYIFYSPAGRQT